MKYASFLVWALLVLLSSCVAPVGRRFQEALHVCGENPPPVQVSDEAEKELIKRLFDSNPPTEEMSALLPKIYEVIAEPKTDEVARRLRYRQEFGSGFVVVHNGKRMLVTAAHLMLNNNIGRHSIFWIPDDEDNTPLPDPGILIRIRDYRGNVFCCSEVIRAFSDRDIALLEIEDAEKLRAETLVTDIGNKEDVEKDSAVFLCGTTCEGRRVAPATVIKHWKKFLTGGRVLINLVQANHALTVGFSGGPVFSKSGKVVGVCVSGDTKTYKYSHFTHPDGLHLLLE